MLGSTFIEAAIGLSLIYLLMSLMCSVICEVIARVLKLRAKYLGEVVERLVGPLVASKIYEHPLVAALYKDAKGAAAHDLSYLPSSLFAQVLIDEVQSKPPTDALPAPLQSQLGPPASTFTSTKPADAPSALAELRLAVDRPKPSKLNKALRALILDPAVTTQAQASAAIARWFDEAMDRLTDRYKQLTQLIVFGLAVGLTLGLNVDTLIVANGLQRDKSLRDTVVASATSFANEHKELVATPAAPTPTDAPAAPTGDAQSKLVGLVVQLEHLNLPIGWPTDEELTAADTKVEAASKAVRDTRDDAKVPAVLAAAARADLKAKSDTVATTPADTDAKTRAERVAAYTAARTLAATAGADEEKANKAIADASLALEHVELTRSEMKGRTIVFRSLDLWTWASVRRFLLRLAGWLFTALAVSLGTRFWFDTLSKLVNIRSEVKPEEKKATT